MNNKMIELSLAAALLGGSAAAMAQTAPGNGHCPGANTCTPIPPDATTPGGGTVINNNNPSANAKAKAEVNTPKVSGVVAFGGQVQPPECDGIAWGVNLGVASLAGTFDTERHRACLAAKAEAAAKQAACTNGIAMATAGATGTTADARQLGRVGMTQAIQQCEGTAGAAQEVIDAEDRCPGGKTDLFNRCVKAPVAAASAAVDPAYADRLRRAEADAAALRAQVAKGNACESTLAEIKAKIANAKTVSMCTGKWIKEVLKHKDDGQCHAAPQSTCTRWEKAKQIPLSQLGADFR